MPTGAVLRPLDEDDVRAKLRELVDKGARAIAVSLLWSFANPAHERAVRRIIREEYKGFHVGYLPVVLSHEVVGKVGEYERTMTAVLDAYLQRSSTPTCRQASSSSWRPPGTSSARTATAAPSC